MELVYRHERPLFVISLIISIIVWFLVFLLTFGFILIFILFGFLSYLFIQSAFISTIRGTAIKIDEEQLPDLYEQYLSCCEKLGIKNRPDIYMIHGDGLFNAIATRFLMRNFVILFSDVVDALEDEKGCINFYIGHELGHIHRKHLIWNTILMPSRIFPLLGPAYSRAREITCDNYGFQCCENPDEAMKGLAALAAGGKRWKTLAIDKYASQTAITSSFWMSFHELTSTYPWLVKRMARLEARGKGEKPILPRRNFFAWFLACFVPPMDAQHSAGNFIVIIAVIGILAAISIPQFAAYRTRSYNAAAQSNLMNATTAQEAYYVDNSTYTDSLDDLVGDTYGLYINEGVTLQIISGDEDGYSIIASHKNGNITYQITGPGGTIEYYQKE